MGKESVLPANPKLRPCAMNLKLGKKSYKKKKIIQQLYIFFTFPALTGQTIFDPILWAAGFFLISDPDG